MRFLRHCNYPHEIIFYSHDWRDYLSFYSRVGGIVANRVHAAVCVAGFGRPAVVLGTDSRIGICRPIGIPAIDTSEATSDWIVDSINQQMDRRDELMSERLALREDTARQYAALIRERLGAPSSWVRSPGEPESSAPAAVPPPPPLPAPLPAPAAAAAPADSDPPALPSQVALCYFGRPPRLLDVPVHDELFRGLVYRAPASVVPALYQRRYYEDYFLLARYFGPRSILEIGSRFGYSLIAMCAGAAPRRVVSIDMESYGNCFDAATQTVARHNLDACVSPAAAGNGASREFIVGDSHRVELDEQFDMIHVDGDHTESGARDDILKFFALLTPGGVMLVDDLDQPAVMAGFRAAVAALRLPPEHVAFHAHKHGIGMLMKHDRP